MIDLRPATDELAPLLAGIGDEQLNVDTPCGGSSVADLLDHIDGLSQAFTAGAEKRIPNDGPQGPRADGTRLDPEWRTRMPHRLSTLAAAWLQAPAWTGTANVGGLESSGHDTGLFAANELVVHGWDLAVATGQPFRVDPEVLDAVLEFITDVVAQYPEGRPGLFSPPVHLAANAEPLQQLIALTGRDPSWAPSRS